MFSVLFLLDSETIETIANKGGGKSGVEKGLSIHSVNKILVFWCLGGGDCCLFSLVFPASLWKSRQWT